MTDTLRIHHKDGVWRWTITAANNEIVEASTQPYNSRESAIENITRYHSEALMLGNLVVASGSLRDDAQLFNAAKDSYADLQRRGDQ